MGTFRWDPRNRYRVNLFRDLYFGILSVVEAEVADNRKRGGGTFVRISASTIIGKLSAPVCIERERESNVSLILFFHREISTTVTGAKSLVETNGHVDEIKKEFPVGNE